MAFSSVPKDAQLIPVSCVYVPGVGFVALSGSTLTNTDSSSNVSTPANLNLSQIGSVAAQMAGSDGITPANVLLTVEGLYNGATIDQQRGNQDNITLLASAAQTVNGNSADQTNYNARGLKVYVKTGTFGTSESTMVILIRGKDPVSGSYYTILTSASLAASSFIIMTVYPGLTAVGNLTANDVLPRTWRIEYSASVWGTGGSTLGISCGYIL